jgi:transposase
VYWELLPAGRTVNAATYCETLNKVAKAMKKKRPHRKPAEVIFQQDNARPHTAKLTKEKMQALRWEVLPHPPYSPDLAPSDLHLFRDMKNHLRNVKFKTETEVKQWLKRYFASKSAGFFVKGIQKLMLRWENVIEAEGHYAAR